MEKTPLADILEKIFQELERLKASESPPSIYADVAVAGIGSTLHLIRCIHTLLASGADPRWVRRFIDRHLRRTMAADATAIVELSAAPDQIEGSFPGTIDDFVQRVVGRVDEALLNRCRGPYELRLTPEEAASGCVLALRLDNGINVDVSFPAGTPDGQVFSVGSVDGVEVNVVARVQASRQGPRRAKPGRAPRRPRQAALTPPNAN